MSDTDTGVETAPAPEGGPKGAARRGPGHYLGLNYLTFTGAMGLSALGDAAWYVALTWTLSREVSAAAAGSLLALSALPRLIALLGGGVLADRTGPRRMMVLADLARCAVMVGAAGMLLLTRPSVTLLFVTAALVALISAFFIPASGAIKPLLLDEAHLLRGNALFVLGLRGGQAAGGPIGAAMISLGGLPLIALTNALGYAASAFASAKVKLVHEVPPPPERKPFLRELTFGIRYLRGQRHLSLILVVIALNELSCAPPVNLGLVLLSDRTGAGAAGAGYLLTAYTVGAVASSFVTMLLPKAKRVGIALIVETALAAVCLAALGDVTALPAGLVLYLLLGLVTGLSGVILVSLTQQWTGAEVRGRVMAVLSLVIFGAAPLANAAYGVALDWLGFAPTLRVFAALCLAATAIVALTPTLRSARLG
ncbi:MFS transporter [Streptomyces sp. NPDC090025]|uniref:MFS transporter n=1 Tax=Streptomyces sp. NPDC090025 TaxID=3365922 RepID=UPI0038352663